jgi:hypothetical protein
MRLRDATPSLRRMTVTETRHQADFQAPLTAGVPGVPFVRGSFYHVSVTVSVSPFPEKNAACSLESS